MPEATGEGGQQVQQTEREERQSRQDKRCDRPFPVCGVSWMDIGGSLTDWGGLSSSTQHTDGDMGFHVVCWLDGVSQQAG